MLLPILNASRYLVLAAVIGALAASLALFVYGLAETLVVIAQAVAKAEVSSKGAKALALEFIEIVDLFLLGTVLLMIRMSSSSTPTSTCRTGCRSALSTI